MKTPTNATRAKRATTRRRRSAAAPNVFPLDCLPLELLQCVRDHLSVRDHKSLALASSTMYHKLARALLARTATRATATMRPFVRDTVSTLLVNEAVSDTALDAWRSAPIRTLIVTDQPPKPEAANEPIFHRPPNADDPAAVYRLHEQVNQMRLPQSTGRQLAAAVDQFVKVFRSPNETPRCRYTHRQLIQLLDLICRRRLSASELAGWLRKTVRDMIEMVILMSDDGDDDDAAADDDDDDDGSSTPDRVRFSADALQALSTMIDFATFVETQSAAHTAGGAADNGHSPTVARYFERWPRLHSGQFLKMYIDSRTILESTESRQMPIEQYLRRLLDSADRAQLNPRLPDGQFFRAHQSRPIAGALEAVADTVEYVIMSVCSLSYPRIGFPYNLMLPKLRVLVNNDFGYGCDHMDTFFRALWKRTLMTCPEQLPNLQLIALGHDAGLSDPHDLYCRLIDANRDEQAVVDVLVHQPRIRELLATGRADRVVVHCRPDTVLPAGPEFERGEPSDCFALLYVWIPTGTIVGAMRSPSQEAQYNDYVAKHALSTDAGKEGDTPRNGMDEMALDKRKFAEREYNEMVRLYDFYIY